MSASKLYWITAVFVAFATFAMAQQAQQPAPPPQTVIKHVPLERTNAASGQQMFSSYCAVCHGTDGKGSGPAATALKVPPTNLTELAAKSNGKYPSLHITAVIRGQADLPAHGNQEMPVWGPLFRHISQGNDGEVQQRIANLNQYIESLQKK